MQITLVKEEFSVRKVTLAQITELAVAEFCTSETYTEEEKNRAVATYIERGGYKQVMKRVKTSEGERMEPVLSPSKAELYERTLGLTAEIQNPAPWIVGQLADLGEKARNLLERSIYGTIRDFVRATYIDQFKEVGEHSLDYIAEQLAKSGRAVGAAMLKLRTKDFKYAVEAFNIWFSQPIDDTGRTRNKMQIDAFTEAAAGKFTYASFSKALGPDNAKPDIIRKVIMILGSFAEQLDNFEGMEEEQALLTAEVIGTWIANLEDAIHEIENPKEVNLLEGI
jgi:hypothetical protein